MKLRKRGSVLLQTSMGLAIICLGVATAWAQQATPKPSIIPAAKAPRKGLLEKSAVTAPMSIEIDIEALQMWKVVLDKSFAGDSIWQLKGTTFLQIPLKITADKTKKIELTSSTFKMNNAKFICYRIESANARPDIRSNLIVKRGKFKPKKNNAPRGRDTHPDAPSRMAKRIEISPSTDAEGKAQIPMVSWRMERFLHPIYASIKSNAGQYKLKMKRELLIKSHPGKPPRFKRVKGEPSAKYASRKRAGQRAYQTKFRAFLDLQKKINALPTTQEEPIPPRIWAIFTVSTDKPDITLSGPSPLPWRIKIDQITGMRRLIDPIKLHEYAQEDGKPVRSKFPPGRQKALDSLIELVELGDHVFSHRAAAYVISHAGLVRYAERGEPLYKMIQTIAKSSDLNSRMVVKKEILPYLITKPGLWELVKDITQDWERTKIWIDQFDDIDIRRKGGIESRTKTIRRSILDPTAVPPRDILNKVMAMSVAHPGYRTALRNAVPFVEIPDSRRVKTITYIINQAPHFKIAEDWLNLDLLGSKEINLAHQTLELLAAGEITTESKMEVPKNSTPKDPSSKKETSKKEEPRKAAATAAPKSAPVIAQGTNTQTFVGEALRLKALVESRIPTKAATPANIKKPSNASPSTPNAVKDPVTGETPPPKSNVSMGKVRLSKHILIHTPKHNLFRLMSANNSVTRKLAWSALRFFNMAPINSGARRYDPSRFDMITRTALKSNPIPTEAVDMLIRQKAPSLNSDVIGALIKFAMAGEAEVNFRAARALIGRRGPLGQHLLKIRDFDKHRDFAASLYLASKKGNPLVINLLKEKRKNNPQLAWFALQVTDGVLPEPSQWYGSTNLKRTERDLALLQLFSNEADTELADGALAALVNEAGGDDDDALDLAAKLRQGQTLAVNTTLALWKRARKDIYRMRITRDFSGNYNLRLRVFEKGILKNRAAAADAEPLLDETLIANARLKATDSGVELQGTKLILAVSSDAFAIRINNPSVLAGLGKKTGALGLTKITEEVLLVPEKDGTWRAVFEIPGSGDGEIRLEPIKSSSK